MIVARFKAGAGTPERARRGR